MTATGTAPVMMVRVAQLDTTMEGALASTSGYNGTTPVKLSVDLCN